MKNIFRYFITGALALAVFGGVCAIETDAQSIMRTILNRMDSHYKALQTLQANVSRRQANPQVGTSEDWSGKMVLVPGKGRDDVALKLNWTKPKDEILLIYKGSYQLFAPGIKTLYEGTTKSQKLGKSGGGVLRMMTMTEAELKASYDPVYEGEETLSGEKVWHIKLTPKTRQDFKHADLWIDFDGMPIQTKVTAHNNETDTFQFSGIKRNDTVDTKTIFKRIQKTDDIKIVKQ